MYVIKQYSVKFKLTNLLQNSYQSMAAQQFMNSVY